MSRFRYPNVPKTYIDRFHEKNAQTLGLITS